MTRASCTALHVIAWRANGPFALLQILTCPNLHRPRCTDLSCTGRIMASSHACSSACVVARHAGHAAALHKAQGARRRGACGRSRRGHEGLMTESSSHQSFMAACHESWHAVGVGTRTCTINHAHELMARTVVAPSGGLPTTHGHGKPEPLSRPEATPGNLPLERLRGRTYCSCACSSRPAPLPVWVRRRYGMRTADPHCGLAFRHHGGHVMYYGGVCCLMFLRTWFSHANWLCMVLAVGD